MKQVEQRVEIARRVKVLTLAAGIVIWLVLLYVAVVTWDDFVEATGDTLDECDRGTCGALGEFTDDRPGTLFVLFLVGTAIPAAAIALLLGRFLRHVDRAG